MRGLARIGAGLALAVAFGRAVAGCGPSSFACESDASCAGLADGLCEANGHCSVPDEECRSGRRYAPHSGELSNRCVGEDETGTGSSQGTEDTRGDVESTSTAATTPTPDGDGSTSVPEPTTTGEDPTVVEPPVDPCDGQALVDEPFAAFPLDPRFWEVYNEPGVAVNVIDGELRLVAVDASLAYSNIGTVFGLPDVGRAGVEVVAVPAPDLSAEAFLVLAELEVAYGFQLTQSQLVLFYDDGFESFPVATLDHDPIEHHWLRLSFDQGGDVVTWENSQAAGEWKRIDELDLEAGFEIPKAQIYIGAGVWGNEPVTADPLAAFGHAFVCEG
jgi:hypothetical protein